MVYSGSIGIESGAEMVEKVCVVCGSAFDSATRSNSAKTCSNLCAGVRRTPPNMIDCKVCGKRFRKLGTAKTCSSECSEQYSKAKGRENARSKRVPVSTTLSCKICGSKFQGAPHFLFCSKNCKNYDRRGYIEKQCVWCGEMFDPKGSVKLCSDTCRYSYSRAEKAAYYSENKPKHVARAVEWNKRHPEIVRERIRESNAQYRRRLRVLKSGILAREIEL